MFFKLHEKCGNNQFSIFDTKYVKSIIHTTLFHSFFFFF